MGLDGAAPTPVVLIVEDEEHIAEALAFVIEEAGYAVRTARNGREALALVAEGEPNLIISDLMMPQVNGEQLLRELRARGIKTPVVLMSAAGRRHVEGWARTRRWASHSTWRR